MLKVLGVNPVEEVQVGAPTSLYLKSKVFPGCAFQSIVAVVEPTVEATTPEGAEAPGTKRTSASITFWSLAIL